jgi:hypothetical protein
VLLLQGLTKRVTLPVNGVTTQVRLQAR